MIDKTLRESMIVINCIKFWTWYFPCINMHFSAFYGRMNLGFERTNSSHYFNIGKISSRILYLGYFHVWSRAILYWHSRIWVTGTNPWVIYSNCWIGRRDLSSKLAILNKQAVATSWAFSLEKKLIFSSKLIVK